MPDPSGLWDLDGFEERIDLWVQVEKPDPVLVPRVLLWVMSRMEDPYKGAKRVPGFDNFWEARVPGTDDPDGTIVVCSYWVDERLHKVTCDLFGTLSEPLL